MTLFEMADEVVTAFEIDQAIKDALFKQCFENPGKWVKEPTALEFHAYTVRGYTYGAGPYFSSELSGRTITWNDHSYACLVDADGEAWFKYDKHVTVIRWLDAERRHNEEQERIKESEDASAKDVAKRGSLFGRATRW